MLLARLQANEASKRFNICALAPSSLVAAAASAAHRQLGLQHKRELSPASPVHSDGSGDLVKMPRANYLMNRFLQIAQPGVSSVGGNRRCAVDSHHSAPVMESSFWAPTLRAAVAHHWDVVHSDGPPRRTFQIDSACTGLAAELLVDRQVGLP